MKVRIYIYIYTLCSYYPGSALFTTVCLCGYKNTALYIEGICYYGYCILMILYTGIHAACKPLGLIYCSL